MESLPLQESRQEKILQLEDIEPILQKTRDELERSGEYPLYRVTKNENREGAKKRNNAIVEKCLQQLLELKNGFASVFETEKGSVYFVLQSNHIVRIKKDDGFYPGSWSIQPVTNYIFFVSDAELQKILGEYRRNLAGKTIQISKCIVGAHPIDFMVSDDETILCDEAGEEKIYFKGRQFGDGEIINNITGIHCGNKIKQIIK